MWIKSQDSKVFVNSDRVAWFEVMELDGQYAVVAVDATDSISVAYYNSEPDALYAMSEMMDEVVPCRDGYFKMPTYREEKEIGK